MTFFCVPQQGAQEQWWCRHAQDGAHWTTQEAVGGALLTKPSEIMGVGAVWASAGTVCTGTVQHR
jgi:hypothetical protein